MAISMRKMFARQEKPHGPISFRNSLKNHFGGLQNSLREAHCDFLKSTTTNGYDNGCRPPSDIEIEAIIASPKIGEFIPKPFVNLQIQHFYKKHKISELENFGKSSKDNPGPPDESPENREDILHYRIREI